MLFGLKGSYICYYINCMTVPSNLSQYFCQTFPRKSELYGKKYRSGSWYYDFKIIFKFYVVNRTQFKFKNHWCLSFQISTFIFNIVYVRTKKSCIRTSLYIMHHTYIIDSSSLQNRLKHPFSSTSFYSLRAKLWEVVIKCKKITLF